MYTHMIYREKVKLVVGLHLDYRSEEIEVELLHDFSNG